MTSLSTLFLGTTFKNPLILPSGILNKITAHSLAEESGCGGVVTKSLTIEPRKGNPPPRLIKYEYGYLNSVGLINPGIDVGVKELAHFVKKSKIPVIASVFGTSVSEFKELTSKVVKAKPDFIELNLSCPNTVDELGQPLGMGVESTKAAVEGVRIVVPKATKIIAKLSPNVPNIVEIAQAAEDAGADAISAINTVGPGMVIDIQSKKPKLGNIVGGVSGPGIRPIAVRCVYEIYKAVTIPIIGIGGVEKWEDVVEMMMAGATLVGVGSAVYLHGYEVYRKLVAGLEAYLKQEKLQSLEDIIGVVHGAS